MRSRLHITRYTLKGLVYTVKEWREISSDPDNSQKPEWKEIYDKGRGVKPDGTVEIPMALSIAEPTKVGGS